MAESAETSAKAVWKEKYDELKARLAAAKRTLDETKAALAASRAREEEVRAKLARVQDRLRWHERALLRPEVLQDLLPSRAAWRQRTPPDAAALERARTHAEVAGADLEVRLPSGAEQVTIAGLSWAVPADARRAGRLADRILRDHWLPLAELLRTREAISAGVMLDIGANIGLTSIPRAVLGDADVIYAAEPEPDNFACLVHNIAANGLRGVILPDRVAISDATGTARLQRSGSIGGHRLTESDGIDVPAMTLDDWVARLRLDPDTIRYVKVDTQGRESHVLDGAHGLLARQGIAWELEFSPEHLRMCGRTPERLIAQLAAHFTHVIDLNPHAPGNRVRPAAELGEALAYLDRSYTNLLLYRA